MTVREWFREMRRDEIQRGGQARHTLDRARNVADTIHQHHNPRLRLDYLDMLAPLMRQAVRVVTRIVATGR